MMNVRTRIAVFAFLLAILSCNRQDAPVIPPSPPDPPVIPLWPSDATIVGTVTTEDGEPLEGIVLSDGYLVCKTDKNGRYHLKSDKKHGYVFMSTPSGYALPSKGVQPQFYSYVGKYLQDTVNFRLSLDEQGKFQVYILGDMHLAAKRRDLEWFEDFVADINSLHAKSKGFALTLGDMTWDAYWDSFDLDDYLNLVNRKFPSLPFYHTVGNHDHDLSCEGDWETVVKYKKTLGPTYYSFNCGGVHFISLDNILCRNSSGKRSSWNEVDAEQLKWLAADLSFVSKSTPVVVASHAPLYKSGGGFYLYNGMDLVNVFKGFQKVYFFTGHSHVCYTTDYQSRGGSYIPVFEGNSGAVCGNWWYMLYDFPESAVNMCPDGAPGGYRVVDIENGDIKWYYKGTGQPAGYQMRTYDRNTICLDPDKIMPGVSAAYKSAFRNIAQAYTSTSSDNYVLINVWDYDDRWTISVTENGKPLKVERMSDYRDPLYLATFEAYSFKNGYVADYGSGLSSYYPSSETNHIFRVKALSASSTLEIKITDRFNRQYTETMKRPKKLVLGY